VIYVVEVTYLSNRVGLKRRSMHSTLNRAKKKAACRDVGITWEFQTPPPTKPNVTVKIFELDFNNLTIQEVPW
jgi:hypothetical protein